MSILKSDGFNSCNGKVTCKSNLNVRSGPGTNYTIKTRLIYGQVVKLTENPMDGIKLPYQMVQMDGYIATI